jgi:hypothetical protein
VQRDATRAELTHDLMTTRPPERALISQQKQNGAMLRHALHSGHRCAQPPTLK